MHRMGRLNFGRSSRGGLPSESFCNVLGFSGTPYLEKAEKVTLGGSFDIKNTNITNVVYYYPLIEGIDNFLKRPEVKFTDNDMLTIVSQGVREFLDKYKDTSYANGTQAKLAIYCGQISTLEEEVYPLVSEIVSGYGMNPAEVVLKRHKGNSSSKAGVKKYAEPEGSEAAFATLDSPTSKIRIVLLVQIGKEDGIARVLQALSCLMRGRALRTWCCKPLAAVFVR